MIPATTHIVVTSPRPGDPLPPEVVNEFEVLLTRLDLHFIKPAEWARIKVILTIATLEAHDITSGRAGYERALAKWRVSKFYDGSD
jgi:hypothetical protein